MIREHFLEHGHARLHYLRAGDSSELTPLVYVPGSLGSAEDFRSEMDRLEPRRTVSMNPRGHGKSSAPAEGYGLVNLANDLHVVLDHLALPPACMMAYSLGVPVALRYATKNPASIKGLILLDYPARYPRRSSEWVDRALPFARQRGIPEHVVYRLWEESRSIELWGELQGLSCPALVVKGGLSQALTDDDLARYRTALPQVQVEIFGDSGHEIFLPDYERFMRTVENFLASLDGDPST